MSGRKAGQDTFLHRVQIRELGNGEDALNVNGQPTSHRLVESNSTTFSTKNTAQFFNHYISQAVAWEIAFACKRAF